MAANLVASLFVFPLLQCIAAGLRITEVEVPRYLMVGQKATLRCQLALEGEVLYSLKWWKDGKQFYQYIPLNKPPAVVFTVPGITINPARSGLHEVELLDVQSSSTGNYRCEVVAEGPTFNTHVMSANMTIVDTTDTKPRVTGLEASYRDGETISLNCTSLRSRPPSTLTWSNNGQKIAKEHLVSYPSATSEDDPTTTTLGLVLTAHASLFTDGTLDLRCSATVHAYEWSTDVSLHLDNVTYSQPHHLPTLQQTDAATTYMSPCVLTLFLSLLTLCLCRRT
ncbi:uncharacterized protein LOC121857409 [Homarus americanus]|uniref:uncharacterized protein LOC121857409 n=1 Tax=Homarus americanus TaxID=6706 RepID=UPI001C47F348|nr:uncharacterized protein LOC121857409 [Homarus americanus]